MAKDITVENTGGVESTVQPGGGGKSFKKSGTTAPSSTTDYQDVTGLAAAARKNRKAPPLVTPTPTPKPLSTKSIGGSK